MRLWLDDDPNRAVPSGVDVIVRTADEAIKWIASGQITAVSLDHDLGKSSASSPVDPGTGYDVARWIEEKAYTGELPRIQWSVHSANPVGAKRMEDALNNANHFWSQHEDTVKEADGRNIYELVRTMPPTEDGVMIDTLNLAGQEDAMFSKDDALKAAEELEIDWDAVDFTPEALMKGMNVELEHGTRYDDANVTDDEMLPTAKIALAHLYEFADYYERLERMEQEAMKETSILPAHVKYKGADYYLAGKGRMPKEMRQGWESGDWAEFTIPETGEHGMGRIIWFVKYGDKGAAVIPVKAIKDDRGEWWPVPGQQEYLLQLEDLKRIDYPGELLQNIKPKFKELSQDTADIAGDQPTLFLHRDPATKHHYVEHPSIPTASSLPRVITFGGAKYERYVEFPKYIHFNGTKYVLAGCQGERGAM